MGALVRFVGGPQRHRCVPVEELGGEGGEGRGGEGRGALLLIARRVAQRLTMCLLP